MKPKTNIDFNCSQAKEMFPDYLTGDLAEESSAVLRQHVSVCASCQDELQELTSTWAQLGVLPEQEPSANLRKNFYTMLESYKEGMSRENIFQRFFKGFSGILARPAYQVAFTIVFLVIGFGGGMFFTSGSDKSDPVQNAEITELRREVRQMRQQVALAMLDQPSPHKRLKAISYTAAVDSPDIEVLDALLNTLNNDENDNVRLSAVEALYLFAHHPRVKQGIIDTLPRQTSPLVQVAIIDLMVEMREKKAADALKTLIQNNKLNPAVKKRAQNVMQQMI